MLTAMLKKELLSKAICVLIVLLGYNYSGYGQISTATSIDDQFQSYQSENFQEKLFVHTDKNFYLAGEILWFKIYAADAVNNKPAGLSKIAYLEILDQDQHAVVQTKVSLDQGSGNGSVYLDVSLKPGNYKIRAYTNWMKNFDPEFYFEKDLAIINSLRENDLASRGKPNPVYDIAFFPEGGNLVEGLKSKVAFRTTDMQGKGVEMEGRLINEKNETVTVFKPRKFGIGSFSFTPQAGGKYSAVIKFPDGKLVQTDLPEVFSAGYVMHVSDTISDQISVTVQSTDLSNSQVYLFGHTRNEKKISEVVTMINGKARFLLNKDQLGAGISSLTIFNQGKQPVCERLYFKQPGQDLMLEVKTSETQYETRSRVGVSMSLHDLKNKGLKSDLSVGIFRVDSLSSIGSDISAYLWLSSDLTGSVESPEYYLNSVDAEAADNLMLSHGWRRFTWEDILEDRIPSFEFLPEYSGHIVSGKVTSSQTGRPVGGISAYLSAPGNSREFYAAKSDEQGRVTFHTSGFYGYREILASTDAGTDSTIRFSVASPFSTKFSPDRVPFFVPFRSTSYNHLAMSGVNVQVRNIYRSAEMNQFSLSKTDSSTFYGKPQRRYLLDNYTRFKTMEEVLREYVTESVLTGTKKQYDLKLLKPGMGGFADNPLVLLDGVPIFNVNNIVNYDPLLIKSIDIINEEYISGGQSFNGIISFRTYDGKTPGLIPEPGAAIIDYEGVQKQREFYSPRYETPEQRSRRLPDFRDLLYWHPEAGTDEQGKRQLNFYTSDQTGKYIIVIQGLTQEGGVISKAVGFEVRSTL